MTSLPRRTPVLHLPQAALIAGAATVTALVSSALWGLSAAMISGTCITVALVVAQAALRRALPRPTSLDRGLPARSGEPAQDGSIVFNDSRRSHSGVPLYEPAPRVLLSLDEAERLFGAAERRMHAAGEAIFYEHDRPNALYLIERGRVAATVTGLDGRQLTFDVMGSGELFGELGLLSDEREPERSATIRTIEPSVTRILLQADFERLRDRDGTVDRLLLRLLRHRVMRLHVQLKEALYVPSEQRVLRRLVDLEQVWSEGRGNTLIRVTKDELADLAGTYLAIVNAILRTEERRGTLEVRPPRRIAILDLPTLKRHAVTGLPGGGLE